MDVIPVRVAVVLCLNRTDGLMESARGRMETAGANIVCVWDVHGANKVTMATDVRLYRTEAFRRNAQCNEIEQALSAKSVYNTDQITFVNADGVLYPCFSMELRIAGGGREQWHIEATLSLAFGFTVEISAAAATIERGRKDCTFQQCTVLGILEQSSTDSFG